MINIHFYSFCSSNWKTAFDRTYNTAINSNFFKSVHILNEYDIDINYLSFFKKILKIDNLSQLYNIKGFGYYFFKPYIWKLAYENTNINDYAMYLDAGSLLNIYNSHTYDNLINLCKLLESYEYQMSFDRDSTLNRYSNKYDILKYFNTESDNKYLNKREFQTGFFIFKKSNDNIYKFIIDGYNFYLNEFNRCITSTIENNKDLINNSVTQAIYNNIIYKMNIENKFLTYSQQSNYVNDIKFNYDYYYYQPPSVVNKILMPTNQFSNIYLTLRRKY